AIIHARRPKHEASRAQRPAPRPRPAPAKPAQARRNDTYQEYWDRRRQEDEARGRAKMAAIAEAASQPQAKPPQKPNPDPFARAAQEVVETFAAMVRGWGAATMSKRLPVSLQRAARGMSGPERESLSASGSFRGRAGQGGNARRVSP